MFCVLQASKVVGLVVVCRMQWKHVSQVIIHQSPLVRVPGGGGCDRYIRSYPPTSIQVYRVGQQQQGKHTRRWSRHWNLGIDLFATRPPDLVGAAVDLRLATGDWRVSEKGGKRNKKIIKRDCLMPLDWCSREEESSEGPFGGGLRGERDE